MVICSRNKSSDMYVFINSDASPYSRSLRKLRKKLRFNIYADIFRPNWFLTLTIAPYYFENVIEKGVQLNVSSLIRSYIKQMKYVLKCNFDYVWRLEVGTQGTRRAHVHMLINFNPSDSQKNIVFYEKRYVKKSKNYKIIPVYDWQETFIRNWKMGALDFEETSNIDKVSQYIVKYLSKKDKELEVEPDPKLYGRQRYNCSRSLLKPPKSVYTNGKEISDALCCVRIDMNIDTLQNKINSIMNSQFNKHVQLDLSKPRLPFYMFYDAWGYSASDVQEYINLEKLKRKKKLFLFQDTLNLLKKDPHIAYINSLLSTQVSLKLYGYLGQLTDSGVLCRDDIQCFNDIGCSHGNFDIAVFQRAIYELFPLPQC